MEGSPADAQRIEDVKGILTDLYQSPRLYKELMKEIGSTETSNPPLEAARDQYPNVHAKKSSPVRKY
jgi:hypothetical protein